MKWYVLPAMITVLLQTVPLAVCATGGTVVEWINPLVKVSRQSGPMGEMTPFVFRNKLYRIENWPKYFDLPGQPPDTRFMEDALRIWDLEDNKLVSKFMVGHSFGYVFMWEGRVYVFAAKHKKDAPWRYYTEIEMTYSDDLVNWAKPQTVIKGEPGEHLFNTAVCWDGRRFVLLYETDDSRWPAFTFKYCTSRDLVHWRRVPGAIYGKEKYVGGPALYFEGGYYYTLYLKDLGGAWETRVTRSKDLKHWEDAPDDRPFLTYDRNYVWHDEIRNKDIPEVNASDAEFCYYKGKTIVYFGGGDQQYWGDVQRAEFKGTPRQLLESYYEEPGDVKTQTNIEKPIPDSSELGKPIAKANTRLWSEDHVLELDLKANTKISAVLLEEDLEHGQRVMSYEIDSMLNGKWVPISISGGKSIGRKQIDRFDPITTTRLRLKILQSLPLPKIKTFEVF